MFVYFENTILNKLIVALVSPFSCLENERLNSYEKFEDLDINKLINEVSHEELVILSSTYIPIDIINDKLSQWKSVPLTITFIIKDAEELATDNYSILNWYMYWTNMLNTLNDHEIDREIIDSVYQYFHKFPTLNQRRIVEYLTSLIPLPNTRFIEILKNETLSMIMIRGKNFIEQKTPEITRDRKNSTTKIIKDIRCTLCISSYVETAYQILDKGNSEAVLLFEINLKTSDVDVIIVTKDVNKIPFSHLVKYKNGILSSFRISFKEFVDCLNF